MTDPRIPLPDEPAQRRTPSSRTPRQHPAVAAAPLVVHGASLHRPRTPRGGAPGRVAGAAALHALLAHLTEGVVTFDVAGQARTVNSAAEALLAAPAATLRREQRGEILRRLAARTNDPSAALAQLGALGSPSLSVLGDGAGVSDEVALPSLAAHAHVNATSTVLTCASDGERVRVTLVTPAGGEGAGGSALLLEPLRVPSRMPTGDLTDPQYVARLLDQGMRAPLADIHAAAKGLLTPPTLRRRDALSSDEALHLIEQQSAALTAALDALADLARLRSGATPLALAPLEVGDLLMAILPRWKPLAPQHSLELALPGALPSIAADETRIARAFDLLLGAAVALTPEGGAIRVHIRARDAAVEVSVRAYGYTLSPEQLGDLWTPFTPVLGLSGPLVGGGVGLALAQAIITTHGGALLAQAPSTGSGTLFVATLPLQPPATLDQPVPEEERTAPSARPLPARVAASRARQVVLLVEGDPRMVRYLRANLEAQRYRPIVARTAAEARQLIDLEEPDLIVLDTGLPGGEVGELLRGLRDATDAPVLALARRHDPDECARVLDGGAVDYIVRPFSIEEFSARLRVALRTHEAGTRAAVREPLVHTGELTIDFAQRVVTVGGKPVSLSKTEFKLLRALAQHAGMVLSHEALLERVWGAAYNQEIEFVWVYIRRLRRKIEPDPSNPRYILTAPGVGYRLVRL